MTRRAGLAAPINRVGAWVAAALAALLQLPCAAPEAAAQAALAEGDRACLACHGLPGLGTRTGDGSVMPLHVTADAFAKSVHGMLGCGACHTGIDPAVHPRDAKPIASERDYALAAVKACRGCHSDKATEFDDSIHARLGVAGNRLAPVCSDCHRPHSVVKGEAQSVETVPCKFCHAPIFDTYLESVHGKARLQNQPQAPLCAGCHTAHAVTAAAVAMGDGMRSACTSCHTNTLVAHQNWLPNTELHFGTVSCAACHAPDAHRKVDLKLIDATTRERVDDPRGVPVLQAGSEAGAGDATGMTAVSLMNVLSTFTHQGIAGKTALRGRLEVMTGLEAHKLTSKETAISDCKTCHQRGAQAFETVTISIADEFGRPIRFGAEEGILSSAISLGPIGGFYVIGGTRMGLLDALLVLALLAGAGIPLLHLTLRMMFRRYAKHRPVPSTPG